MFLFPMKDIHGYKVLSKYIEEFFPSALHVG
jgi:hypothetical protein